jgi:hypothetical protein
MKAQADSNSRGRKDFICREFSWRKEKRKTAYWRVQGDPETSDPVGQGGEWGFIAYLHCLMPFRCKRAFPREKCLLDHLSPFGTSHSPSFSPSLAQTQRTCVQRLSPENKGVSLYVHLQAGYRGNKTKQQGLTHIWLYAVP